MADLDQYLAKKKILEDALNIREARLEVAASIDRLEAEKDEKITKLVESFLEKKKMLLDATSGNGSGKKYHDASKVVDDLDMKLDKKIGKLMESFVSKKRPLQEVLQKLESNPAFKSESQIQELSLEIESLSSDTSDELKTDEAEEEDIKFLCPICFERPLQIFCCSKCDNMVCQDCVDKITFCPLCRNDFKEHPPARNRLAERILSQKN